MKFNLTGSSFTHVHVLLMGNVRCVAPDPDRCTVAIGERLATCPATVVPSLFGSPCAALLEAVRRSMRKIRDAIGAAEIDPALLTSAERRHFEGAELWRHLRSAGFNGSLRVMTEWATRKRRDEVAVPVRSAAQAAFGKSDRQGDDHGSRCCPRHPQRAMVERPDRRPDHQAQAREAPNVWPSQTRPAPRQSDGSMKYRRKVAPKVRKSSVWAPIRGPGSKPIDI